MNIAMSAEIPAKRLIAQAGFQTDDHSIAQDPVFKIRAIEVEALC